VCWVQKYCESETMKDEDSELKEVQKNRELDNRTCFLLEYICQREILTLRFQQEYRFEAERERERELLNILHLI